MKGSDGVIIRRLATVWETDYQPTNGAYGVYPVECKNILIEDSFVQGSADAGIYVGQSEDIVVRNNIAIKNVAGIEIENSKRADVYGNLAEGNTGGILIFDLPIGNGIYGAGVRVFDNEVIANNAPNFANKSAFAGGINLVAEGVKGNIPDAGEFTEINLELFAAYPTDGGVCQSSNNINGVDLFAASVFETTATTETFTPQGNPLSKLEQLDAGDVTMAWNIFADPNGVMSCGEGFTGAAATVSFGENKFGCLEDDKENASCLL